ncbi:hypothetical protein [endosymbiont GvMRE of Glomus versiforme]|nr:hypothetical protein [endosymbiont GvMRE of Glomus versiforme]RHZ37703.1 hypothetical protein GvMRE_I1g237 [endosymbiont GvMRE of Glomus versiforme]
MTKKNKNHFWQVKNQKELETVLQILRTQITVPQKQDCKII